MVELRQLNYFVTIAEELNISKAAKKLNISQPPLTRQLKSLENKIGTILFERSTKGIILTDAGKIFLSDAYEILKLSRESVNRVHQSSIGVIGKVDVAVFGSVMFDEVSQVLAKYQENYPKVKIALHTMNKGEQIQALLNNQIHLGFSRMLTKVPGIACELVKHEKLYIAVHTNSTFNKKKSIKLNDLDGYPLVLFASGKRPNFIDSIYSLFETKKIYLNIKQIVEDSVTGVSFVAAGFGACLIPESVTFLKLPNILYLPVEGVPDNFIDLNCLYRQNEESILIKNFLLMLKNFKKQNKFV